MTTSTLPLNTEVQATALLGDYPSKETSNEANHCRQFAVWLRPRRLLFQWSGLCSVLIAIEMEVEPGSDRLDLYVVFDNIDRCCECRSSVKVIGAKVNEAVLHTEADVARHLVLKPSADGPSIVPIADGKAIRQCGIPPRHVDLGTSPSSLGIDEPLIGCKAQTTSHCRDRIDVGAVGHGWIFDAAEIIAQCGGAQRRFCAEHDAAELLVVADLATTDKTGFWGCVMPILYPVGASAKLA
jgi:hypothetical protein